MIESVKHLLESINSERKVIGYTKLLSMDSNNMLSYQLHWSYFHQQHESNKLVGSCTRENFQKLVAFCITTEFIEHPFDGRW